MTEYRKIVVASDSFKGSLSSICVAEAVEKAFAVRLPDCEVVKLPMADGGEGTLFALISASGGSYVRCAVHDPLMREIDARYGMIGDCAVIEMAAASGLTLLDEKERNPMKTTSFGTGEMIRHAIESGCRKIFITIGGSATNDAGLGALQALGLKVFTGDGNLMRKGICGGDLIDIEAFDATDLKSVTDGAVFNVACDVNNPFYGKDGAAYVYGQQKGATMADIAVLDNGLRHVADKICAAFGYDVSNIKGSGAAGGMGGASYAFLSASLSSGVELTLDLLKFDKHIADADLIVTGEGRFDEQTLRGKVVAGVVDRAARYGKKVLVLTGRREYLADLGENVTVVEISPRSAPLSIAMREDITFANIIKSVNAYLDRSE